MIVRFFASALAAVLLWASAASAQPAVPAEVGCYVEAVNGKNLDRLMDCFAADAVIVDVSRTIAGAEAIRRWAEQEVIGGSLDVISIEAQDGGRYRCLVTWAPGGSGGWRAWYTFTVDDGRITGMDLQYA